MLSAWMRVLAISFVVLAGKGVIAQTQVPEASSKEETTKENIQKVRVRFVDPDGKPVPEAKVFVRYPTPSLDLVSDRDGFIEFQVPTNDVRPGRRDYGYYCEAASSDASLFGTLFFESTNFESPELTEAPVVTLSPTEAIEVIVVDDRSEKAVSGVTLMHQDYKNLRVTTDQDGRAVARVPKRDIEKEFTLIAWTKDGRFDYQSCRWEGEHFDEELNILISDAPVSFQLRKLRRQAVQAVDFETGKPIPDLPLSGACCFQHRSGFGELPAELMSTTDEQGKAVLWHYISSNENNKPTLFESNFGGVTTTSLEWSNERAETIQFSGKVWTVPFLRMKTITGVVVDQDDRPVKDSYFCLSYGLGKSSTRVSQLAFSEGRFEFILPSHCYGVLYTEGQTAAIEPKYLTIRHDREYKDLKLTVKPQTVVEGRFLANDKSTPRSRTTIKFKLVVKVNESLPESERLHDPEHDLSEATLELQYNVRTDEEGNYRIALPKGDYELYEGHDDQKLIDFTSAGTGTAKLDVISKQEPQAVAH